ncbi:hypothetical protein E2I00_010230, partial [Balaenoptera physalus]
VIKKRQCGVVGKARSCFGHEATLIAIPRVVRLHAPLHSYPDGLQAGYGPRPTEKAHQHDEGCCRSLYPITPFRSPWLSSNAPSQLSQDQGHPSLCSGASLLPPSITRAL